MSSSHAFTSSRLSQEPTIKGQPPHPYSHLTGWLELRQFRTSQNYFKLEMKDKLLCDLHCLDPSNDEAWWIAMRDILTDERKRHLLDLTKTWYMVNMMNYQDFHDDTFLGRLLFLIREDTLARPIDEILDVLSGIVENLRYQKWTGTQRRTSSIISSPDDDIDNHLLMIVDKDNDLLLSVLAIRFDIDRGKQLIPMVLKLIKIITCYSQPVSHALRSLFTYRDRFVGPELMPLICILREAGADPFRSQKPPFLEQINSPSYARWCLSVYSDAWTRLTSILPLTCSSLRLILEWVRWELIINLSDFNIFRLLNHLPESRSRAINFPLHTPTQIYQELMQCIVVVQEMDIKRASNIRVLATQQQQLPNDITNHSSISTTTITAASASAPVSSLKQIHLWIEATLVGLPNRLCSSQLIDLVVRPGACDLSLVDLQMSQERFIESLLFLVHNQPSEIRLDCTSCESPHPRSLLELILTGLPLAFQPRVGQLELFLVNQLPQLSPNMLPPRTFLTILEQINPKHKGEYGWLLYEQLIRWQSNAPTISWWNSSDLPLSSLFLALGGAFMNVPSSFKELGNSDSNASLKPSSTMYRDHMILDLLRECANVTHDPVTKFDFFSALVSPISSTLQRVVDWFECVGCSTDRLWPDRGGELISRSLLDEALLARSQLGNLKELEPSLMDRSNSICELLKHEEQKWKHEYRFELFMDLDTFLIPPLAEISLAYLLGNYDKYTSHPPLRCCPSDSNHNGTHASRRELEVFAVAQHDASEAESTETTQPPLINASGGRACVHLFLRGDWRT